MLCPFVFGLRFSPLCFVLKSLAHVPEPQPSVLCPPSSVPRPQITVLGFPSPVLRFSCGVLGEQALLIHAFSSVLGSPYIPSSSQTPSSHAERTWRARPTDLLSPSLDNPSASAIFQPLLPFPKARSRRFSQDVRCAFDSVNRRYP